MSSFEEYYSSWQKKKPKVYEETENQTQNAVTKNQILPTIKKTILPKVYSVAKSTILPKLKTNGVDKQRDFLVDSLDKTYNAYNDIKSGKAITSKDLLMSLYNTGEGAKLGVKQSLDYIENANENVLTNYKGLKKNQFLTSNKISDNDKAIIKSQDNKLLIGASKLNEEKKQELLNNIPDEKVETNLVKKSIEDSIKEDKETIAKNIENTDTEAGKYIAGLTPSIGQMGVGTVASAINPVLGSTYFMTSAGGSYIDDAKQRGMSDKDAFKYGTTMGALEGATEMIGVGKLFKGSTSIGKSAVKQGLKDLGISVADNFIQESVIEPLSELTAGKYANWDNIWQRTLQAGIDGAVVGGIMAGAGGGVGTAQNVINKIQNNQKVTSTEIRTAIEDSKKAGINVDQIVQQQIQTSIKDIGKQKSTENQNILQSQPTTIQNEQINPPMQQTIQPQNKTTQNGNMEQINNNLANNGKTLYNDIALGETKNVPIEGLLSLQTNGGYRNQEQIKNLREDISKNGIQTPIELVRNNDGSITIENGNHRLQIAKELGIKEVPVKFVDSWDNIGIKTTNNSKVKEWEDGYNGNNGKRAGTNESNEGTELFKRSMDDNRNQLGNGTTATTNDRLLDKVQAYNDGTSSNSTFEKNNQELEESSSINLAKNRESQNKTVQDEYDMPYRDDVKIKNPKQSSFYKNAMSSELLNSEAKRKISKNENARFYEGITNKETFANASETLNSLGDNALSEFNSIENKNATAEDVALGLQLMKKYQDKGDYVTEAQIAGKLREIGTESGQTVQAFSILQRMSPEGVLIYTQKQIENAKKEILKNKSQSWIDKNQEVLDNLNLTQEEAKKIVENMKEVNNTENQRQKEILLGEVQKIITDKIPATLGDSFKAYRRISMLFNPKTIVRNITGNIGVAPINMIGDSTIGTLADKIISKKTGMRTTGTTNLKTYGKGFKEGAVQAFDDFRRGINTRDINGDKFEIGSKGKSFNDNQRLGKALNKIDALTNFSLDVGDRPFFKAEFMNELENLMKLNNVSEPTVDMIETATKVAEQRTWQDSNKYSDTVLNIRKGLNGINIGGVGFGDIVIPFAKTPANLTKAIVDYSPLGVINAIVDANKLNKATSKGQNTAIMQKKLVDDVSKAFMGSMLYIIGTGLAKAGITSGEVDDDKDIANFEKNILGIQPYSIKIGDKSFTYDWAQPLAAPLGITANLTKKNKSESAAQSIFNAISQGGNMLYEQSFLQNLKKLLDGDDIVKGSIEAIADIPSSLVPTFIKQIAEVVDPTARTTYEYNNIPKTALNKVVAKLPFASKTLQPATDTMGRSIMKNGAEEGKIPNIFNIFLNPATTAKRKENPSAEEIYRLYKETGDKTVFPRVAPYYETLNKEKVVLTPKQKTKIQQISGTKANSLIAETIKSNAYKKLSDEEKVKIINDLVDYSFGKATNEVIKKDLSPENKSIQKYIDNGLTPSNAVIFKNTINNIEGKKGIDGKNIEGSSSGQKALAIMKMNVSDDQKNKMLSLITTSKNPETVNTLSRLEKSEKAYTDYFALNKSDTFFQTKISRDDMQDIQDLGINQDEFMKFAQNIGNIKSEKDKNGKTISGSKKKAVANYINSLNLSSGEKAILFAKAGYPDKSYKQAIYNYINGLNLSATRKKEIWDSLGYK